MSAGSRGWCQERRARQAAAIREWRPWERSTGPRTTAGKAVSSRNAFKGSSVTQALQEITKELRRAWHVANKTYRGRS
jgi:hypothetical protein